MLIAAKEDQSNLQSYYNLEEAANDRKVAGGTLWHKNITYEKVL